MRINKVGKDNVTIEWGTPNKDGGAKLIGYQIFKMADDSESWEHVAKVKPFDSYYTIPDMKIGKGYYFAVAAENEIGVGKRCETESLVKPKKPLGENSTSVIDS